MSKYLKFLVATLAMTALATPALAIQGDIKGFFQARAIASNNVDDLTDTDATGNDDHRQAVDQRFRLWTNGALNENVKAVFAIEVDNVWGDTGAAGKQVGKIGADAKGQIEIKHVYLDFNIPELNTNVKAGTQGFAQGRDLIVSDDAAGIYARVACPIVQGNSLGLMWIKAGEFALNDDAADQDYYSVQYDMKAGDWKVAPYVGYFDRTDNDRDLFLGVDAGGKIGSIALDATAIYNDGKTGADDYDGFALWAKAAVKAGNTTFSLEAARFGAEDNGGQFGQVSRYVNFAEVLTGGRFDGRGTVGHQTVGDTYGNWLYAKLGLNHTINENNKISAAYIYAQEAVDSKVAGVKVADAATAGHEIDVYYDYTIVKGLDLTLGGGYLLADDDLVGPGASADDAWKIGSALTYKF